MIPYPDSFPTDALSIVLSKLRGGDLPIPDLVHACWVVAGYALSQIIGGGPSVKADGNFTDEEVIELALASQAGEGIKQGFFAWRMVLAIVLRLLREACSCC
jgi:uncharacterized membrane protein YqaE (UPF0057 family)